MTRSLRCFCFLSLTLLFSNLAAERPVIYMRLTDSLTMDPGKIEDFFSQEVIFNVFEGLVRLGKDAVSVEPCLAERWTFRENGKRWIFYLRRGVRFHNGAEFNSGPWSIPSPNAWPEKMANTSPSAGFSPMSPRSGPWMIGPWRSCSHGPISRSCFPWPICAAAWWPRAPATGGNSSRSAPAPMFFPSGSRAGPWRSPVSTNYWQQPARLEKIIFKSEPNPSLRLSQIKNRGADIDLLRSAKEVDELRDKTHIAILSEPMLSTNYLGFNCRRPPFSRLAARKAFVHLLNKRVLVKQIFQNFARPAAGFLPPQMAGHNPGIGKDDFDLKKAQHLLMDAGLAGGFSCSLYIPQGQFGLADLARTLASNARQIGITIKVVALPFARLLPAVQNGEPDLFLLAWGYSGDPGIFLNPLFMLYPGDKKSTMAASPEFVSLLARAEETGDDGKRGELYAAAQRRLQEDMPLIPLFHLNHLLAYNTRLRGLRMNPFGFLIFKDAYLGAE